LTILENGQSVNDSRPAPSLLYSVKRLELVIRLRLDEMLRGADITTLQYTALTVLEHRDGISAAQLARDSFVSPQAMTDMLKSLTKRDLIRREPNPASRRELLIYLTDTARELLAHYDRRAAEIESMMVADLRPDEVAQLRDVLDVTWRALQVGDRSRISETRVSQPAAR
jgi:DNA-binding MarR family transcriptional regulator